MGGKKLETTKVKFKSIAKIIMGLPILRYTDKEDIIEQEIIENKSVDEIDQDFETDTLDISSSINSNFYSKEHDILYKVQQNSFAKEITTEVNAIIPNSYIIIRVDKTKANPTFITNYLNNPIIDYEIQRQIDSTKIMKVNTSILKNLDIELPSLEVQEKYVNTINKINERINVKKQSIKCDQQLINSLYDKIIGDKYE